MSDPTITKKRECTCCFHCGTPGAVVHQPAGREAVKLHKPCIPKYEEWLARCSAAQAVTKNLK